MDRNRTYDESSRGESSGRESFSQRRNTTSSRGGSGGWTTVASRRGPGQAQQGSRRTFHGTGRNTNRHRPHNSRGRGGGNDRRIAREWMQKLKDHRWNLRDLEECFEKIPKRDVFHFNFVMSVYAKRKNTRRVEELLEMMIEENVPQDVFTYTTLMKAYGTNPTKAEEVLTRMKEAGVKPDVTTYTTLMNAYGTNITKAEEVLTRMKKAGVKPNVTTYTTLMKAYGKNPT